MGKVAYKRDGRQSGKEIGNVKRGTLSAFWAEGTDCFFCEWICRVKVLYLTEGALKIGDKSLIFSMPF